MALSFKDEKRGFGKDSVAGCMTKRECCFFGCLPQALYGGGMFLPVCGFSSDLDQNRAVFWSKSELETPETPETLETLETPETLDVDVRIAFL